MNSSKKFPWQAFLLHSLWPFCSILGFEQVLGSDLLPISHLHLSKERHLPSAMLDTLPLHAVPSTQEVLPHVRLINSYPFFSFLLPEYPSQCPSPYPGLEVLLGVLYPLISRGFVHSFVFPS